MRRGGLAAGVTAVIWASACAAVAQTLDYAVSNPSPDQPTHVARAWSLSAQPAPDFATRMEVSLAAGQSSEGLIWPGSAVAADRAWRDLGFGLASSWTPSGAARLELRLDDRMRSLPLVGAVDATQNDRAEQTAQISAALEPLRGIALRLTGRVLSATDAVSDTSPGSRMELKTHGQALESSLRWAATPQLAFEAGARVDADQVMWREQATAAQSYAAVQPSIAVILNPWANGEWRVGFARAVTPLDSSRFVTLARLTDFSGGARLDPDSEWRLQGVLSQELPAKGRLKLTLTGASIERATELTRVGAAGAEGPGNTPGGDRREFTVSLTMPLVNFGLRDFALESSAGWRRSQIEDPLTGIMRRPSGEAAYDGRVSLAQTLPHQALKWGLDAHAVGPQNYYGLSQTTAGAADQTFGAFVEYRPSDLLLRLSVDNLTGDTRRWQDSFYDGDRDLGALARVVRRDDGAPSFSLSLHRAL